MAPESDDQTDFKLGNLFLELWLYVKDTMSHDYLCGCWSTCYSADLQISLVWTAIQNYQPIHVIYIFVVAVQYAVYQYPVYAAPQNNEPIYVFIVAGPKTPIQKWKVYNIDYI